MQGRVKPDPYAFKLILNYTKLKPENHLFIGDSDKKEMIPAKKLGMKTCLVWGKSKVADISLKTVYEVESLFKTSNKKK
ncbi:HAD family hydrolase [Patescibacteria group bacterium]